MIRHPLRGIKTFFILALPFVASTLILLWVYAYSVLEQAPSMLITYRFYRTLYVIIAGSVLAFSGVVLQVVLRNPLVDHYVLGVGSGALFATYVSIAILGYNPAFISSFSIAGGLSALFLSVFIAERISGSDVAYVLAGISVTTLFSGFSLFVYYYLIARYPFAGLLLVGSFVHAKPSLAVYMALPVSMACFGYVFLSKRLNTMILGDDFAAQLGVNPRVTRMISSIIAGASSSVVVGFFGTIGFIGLMAPHIARLLLRTSDSRVVIPLSTTIGTLLLSLADFTSRYVTAPIYGEVPAGVLVSAVGAPFFILLLLTRLGGRRL